MSWSAVQGHDDNIERFRRAVDRGRLASTFFFVGPRGVGKRTFARQLAKVLLCDRRGDEFDSCDHCDACTQVDADTHPDLITISKPDGKSFIPVELLIGDREHRMREGLCHQISLKPYGGKRKVAIIDDADYLNQEGANALLKTLEEPPPRSLLILIGTSVQKQLPTILSRSQMTPFTALPTSAVAELLKESELVDEDADVEQLALLGQGSFQAALEMSDPQLADFQSSFLSELAQSRWNAVDLSQRVAKYVDDAGKEATLRRERMNHLFDYTAEFYRLIMRRLAGASPENDDHPLNSYAATAASAWSTGSENAGSCAIRCLEAIGQVAANANQSTLLECWLVDLYHLSRSASPRNA